jgi:hypothetical protein
MKTRLLTTVGIATALLLAEGLWVYVLLPRPAEATRNSSGTYSLPTGNPVVAGTTISVTTHNTTMSDIASELTDSLSRSGKGGMSAALKVTDGTVAAPGYSFTNEAGTGLYRIGSTDVGFSVNGTKKLELTSSLFTVTPAASFSSTLGVTGATTLSSTLAVTGTSALSDTLTQTIAGTTSTTPYSALQASLANSNAVNLIIGAAASNNSSGGITYTKNATAANSTMCMNVYGQTTTLCVNGNNATTITQPTITTGLTNSGTGFMHIRAAGCATAAAAGATCITTLTLAGTFADTNYTAVCSGNGITSGVPVAGATTKATTQITFNTVADTGAAAQFTSINCIAVHD